MKKRILFLLKQNYNYGSYSYGTCKAGLLTSATLAAESLTEAFGFDTLVKICVDGNSIDKEVHDYKPDYCILEAIWVTPTKLAELVGLHPTVTFVVRIHSKTTFLAMEGVSISWIKQFDKIPNVYVGFNNIETAKDFNEILGSVFYLPNLYPYINPPRLSAVDKVFGQIHCEPEIHIGCFGAIRPMKNQLEQAMAAIIYGDRNNKRVYFHINSSRVEQTGDNVLKNLRALFNETPHVLAEEPWLERNDFLNLVKKMDIGLQLSLTESFNIVTADFVSQYIPILVSNEISWMPDICKVGNSDTPAIVDSIGNLLERKKRVIRKQADALNEYNVHSIRYWKWFLV